MTAVFFLGAVCLLPVFPHCESRQTQAAMTSYVLVATDRDHTMIAEIPLTGGRFDHVFLHSIHLTPVVERFRVIAGPEGEPVLHLYELDYESCGVGMPSEVDEGFHLVDGKFILDMSRDFLSIPLMVSTVEGHGVSVDNRFYPFTDWVPRETFLFLTAKAVFDAR
jgi:hypothetical protein